jgi:hypothetical protein
MTIKLAPLVLAILLGLVGPAAAQAGRPPGAPAKSKKEPVPLSTPMVFYLAKGDQDACGPGCSEWIAAEGELDLGAAQRFRSFLTRPGAGKLPIFFHSPGGIQEQAIAIGRLLRERGMTAGVARTVPADCAAASDPACRALKRSGQKLAAELQSQGYCFSACVYGLIGAKVRQVPPGAQVGVHSGRLVQLLADGRVKFATANDPPARGRALVAEFSAQIKRYLQEMGMDARLFELIAKVPFERMHILSRDEIAGFGIDTREFQESRWMAVNLPPQPSSVMKFIVDAGGADRKAFRFSIITFACAGPRVMVAYFRGLRSDETAAAGAIKIAVDDRSVALPPRGSVAKIDITGASGSFDARIAQGSWEFLDSATTVEHIDVIEAGPAVAAPASSTVRLSTAGLAQAVKALRQRCGAAI